LTPVAGLLFSEARPHCGISHLNFCISSREIQSRPVRYNPPSGNFITRWISSIAFVPETSLVRVEAFMKSVAIIAVLCSFLTVASAQSQQSITPDLLQELETSCAKDAQFNTVHNAVVQADGRKIALDWEKIVKVDPHFSKRLADEKIADQKASGRCWLFSGLNIFRRAAASNLKSDEFEFSQSYLFFYDKLEKANVFLDAIARSKDKPYTDRYVEWLLRTPIQEGGNWLGFIELVKKYGAVPRDVMPETFSSSNSDAMNAVLSLRLKVAGVKIRKAATEAEIQSLRSQALKDVYRILALHLGLPPKQFQWRYETKEKSVSPLKTYTPQQFYHEVTGDVLDDYLALYAIPTLATGAKYEIDLDKALVDRPNMFFVNTSVDQLKQLAQKCLLDDQPVWFGCDVGQEFSRDDGVLMPMVRDYESMYGMDFSLSRKELFETYSSIPNHNMVFTGVDMVDGKPVKWLVENSWGDKIGKKGYLLMLDGWFDRYVQVVVVHKKYIPDELLKVFSSKAEVLPPWDPMMKAIGYE
jgi:bleomycin hydrolase